MTGTGKQEGYLHCTRSREELSSCLKDLSAIIIFLGDSFKIVLKRAVVKLHRAHRLGDEWVVVLIRARLNQGDVERRMVFFETRCQDTACEPTTEDEVVGHYICQGELVGLELLNEQSMWMKREKETGKMRNEEKDWKVREKE